MQRFLHLRRRISTWVGKAFAWIILVLMARVCVEVFKRYILNAPTAWIFNADYMMYGTLFMMTGAYTLAQNGHVRGDFLYGSMRPRTQAWLDLVLYIVFFLPGIAALVYAGWTFAHDSLEHRRAFQRHRRRAAGLSVQGSHPDRRRAGAAAGHRRDRPLHRLPADRRMAEPAEGRRRDRRRRGAARGQRIRRRGIARAGDQRVHEIDEAARQRGMGGDVKT